MTEIRATHVVVVELTERQEEVLLMQLEGLSTPELAERMDVTERGAKAMVLKLMHKYGVPHKRNLIPIALEVQRRRNARIRRGK